VPDAVALRNALAPADDAESAGLLKGQAGGIRGDRRTLQRPDAVGLRTPALSRKAGEGIAFTATGY
jgi:hypothetical protein